MKNKNFVFGLLVRVSVVYISIGLIVNIVDANGMNNKFKFNFNTIKIFSSKLTIPRYLKELSINKSVLVFGTSRALRFSSEVLNSNVIKPHHVYGNPNCVVSFLQQLNKKEIQNIEKIYYNLSNLVFNGMKLCEPVDYKEISIFDSFFFNISFDGIKDAYNTVVVNLNKKELKYKLTEFGSVTDINNIIFKPNPIKNEHYFLRKLEHERSLQVLTIDTLNSLKEIDKFAKKNMIEIIYFTDALTDYQNSIMNFLLTEKFHEKLLTVIGGYYGLNYIDDFSDNYLYFFEKSHINTNGAKYIVNNIFKNTESKYYITEGNIDEYLKYLENNYKKSKEKFLKKQ